MSAGCVWPDGLVSNDDTIIASRSLLPRESSEASRSTDHIKSVNQSSNKSINQNDQNMIILTFKKTKTQQQAGRRLDSTPSANVVAMATNIGPPRHLPW